MIFFSFFFSCFFFSCFFFLFFFLFLFFPVKFMPPCKKGRGKEFEWKRYIKKKVREILLQHSALNQAGFFFRLTLFFSISTVYM